MSPPGHALVVHPPSAIAGARIDVTGGEFPVSPAGVPDVWIGEQRARVTLASASRLGVLVPSTSDGGRLPIRIDGMEPIGHVDVGAPLATGLHQVDNPVFDAQGHLFVTYSGTRGQQLPVSIFRVRTDGTRETFSSGVVNPTSMAVSPDGRLYVSSRFEGAVYRLNEQGTAELFASDLGVACGLAFAADGSLFVGDRSGTVFRVDHDGRAAPFATLPPSVAAFHLAMRHDGTLFVSVPSLASHDPIYEIRTDGTVVPRPERFGRPQGLAFDRHGALLVVEALAGASGVFRLTDSGPPEQIVAGVGLVGIAVSPVGGLVVCSNDTAHQLPPD